MSDNVIALLEFDLQDEQIVVTTEAHYKLVAAKSITERELQKYNDRAGQ
jgi:hypothetical protein